MKGSTSSPAARVPAVSWEVIAAVSAFQATDEDCDPVSPLSPPHWVNGDFSSRAV